MGESICNVGDCTLRGNVGGMCLAHYERWRENKVRTFSADLKLGERRLTCTEPYCYRMRDHRGDGLRCAEHLAEWCVTNRLATPTQAEWLRPPDIDVNALVLTKNKKSKAKAAPKAKSTVKRKPAPSIRAVGTPADLYRFYGEDGALLYVGISLNAAVRAARHSRDKDWWPDVKRMDVQHFNCITRPELEQIEREAIKAEHPQHNVTHNLGR